MARNSDPDALVPGIPPPENKIFYPAIDGLRAVAALLVFAHHYVRSYRVPLAARWGWIGVNIFFVLSGFLITGILFDTRNHPHRLRNFYVRRALRVFPLYYSVFVVLLLSTPWMHWTWMHNSLLWLVYLGNWLPFFHAHGAAVPPTMMSAPYDVGVHWVHFWTLCVEEQFYLVWPFVVFFVRDRVRDRVRLRNLCFVVIAFVPLLRLAFLHFASLPDVPRMLDYATPFQIDGLMLGAALALMLRGPEADRVRRSAGPMLAGAGLLLAISWIFADRVLHQGLSAMPTVPWISTVGFSLVDFMAAAVLLFTLVPGNIFYRAFSLKPLRWMGQISYGFYVFHYLPYDFYARLAHRLVGNPVTHDALTDATGLLCTVILAYLSFRFLRRPFCDSRTVSRCSERKGRLRLPRLVG